MDVLKYGVDVEVLEPAALPKRSARPSGRRAAVRVGLVAHALSQQGVKLYPRRTTDGAEGLFYMSISC